MQFTIADGGMAAVTIISGILAYARGFTRESLAISGWFAAAALAFVLTPGIEPLVRKIPLLGGFLAGSCILSTIGAFTLIVAVTLLILSIVSPIFSNAILKSSIGPLDRGMGFLFGIARAAILIALAYMVYARLSAGTEGWSQLENAGSRLLLDWLAEAITGYLPDEMPSWLEEQIDALMASCTEELQNPLPALPAPLPQESLPTDIDGT